VSGLTVRTVTLKDVTGAPVTVPVSDILGFEPFEGVHPVTGLPVQLSRVIVRVGIVPGSVANNLRELATQLEEAERPRIATPVGLDLSRFAKPA
jgi:hypothetical protein